MELEPIKETILVVVSSLVLIFFVVLIVAFGWWLVWKLFLSKFNFIRELLGNGQDRNAAGEPITTTKPRTTRKVRRE
ncbi:small integral membrane protein 13 [Oratosquilla oratoria]|uniref:small integral membrane protein 13 n=1 Tax=Oratosquilla oratoria TaxID=337810 RepID=UPI003F776BEC